MQNWLQLSVCLYIFFFTISKWWVPSDVGQISLLNKTHVQPATPPQKKKKHSVLVIIWTPCFTFNKNLDEQNYGPAKVKKTYICTLFSVHYAESDTSTHLRSLNDFCCYEKSSIKSLEILPTFATKEQTCIS